VGHPRQTRGIAARVDKRVPPDGARAVHTPGGDEVGRPDPSRPRRGRRIRAIARGFEIVSRAVLAGILLGLTLPVIMVAMTITILTSGGPALYTQWRVGRGGRRFKIYKIRTMIHDCEGTSGPRWASPDDPRVTRVGRFLRRTHLDELPQFWNVIRGDMSFVGPRPERPEIVEEIAIEIPSYVLRTAIDPGITGLAQILLGPDVDLDSVRRKLDCDRYYMVMRRGSPLNRRILLATPFRMIGLSSSVLISLFQLPSPEDCRRLVAGLEEADREASDRPGGER